MLEIYIYIYNISKPCCGKQLPINCKVSRIQGFVVPVVSYRCDYVLETSTSFERDGWYPIFSFECALRHHDHHFDDSQSGQLA